MLTWQKHSSNYYVTSTTAFISVKRVTFFNHPPSHLGLIFVCLGKVLGILIFWLYIHKKNSKNSKSPNKCHLIPCSWSCVFNYTNTYKQWTDASDLPSEITQFRPRPPDSTTSSIKPECAKFKHSNTTTATAFRTPPGLHHPPSHTFFLKSPRSKAWEFESWII